jgi:tetratricopeptide (TPR) repeat protein
MVAGKQARKVSPRSRRGPRRISRVRAPQWTNLPAVGPEKLSALRADVDRARGEYRLSHPADAERVLLRPLRALQAVIAIGPPPGEERETHLLHANAWTVLGRSRRKLGHPRQAHEAFEQAATTFERLLGEEESAGSPMDWADYGMALEHLERPAEAVAAFQVAIDRGVSNADVHRHMGFALRELDPDRAERCFEQVLRLTPDDPYALRTLADHIESRRPGGAAGLLLQAAFGYAFRGEVVEALELFERTLELVPGDPDALAGQAEMLRLLDRCEHAVEVFDRSLVARPDTPWVMAGKAAALHRMGHNEDALALLDETLAIAPDFAFARATRGRVQRALFDLEGSAHTLRAIPAHDPGSAWILADLGETLRLLGKDTEALDVLDRALDLMPRDAAALATRSAIRLAQGNRERAMRDVTKALEVEPQSAFAHTVLGQIHYEAGDFDEAVRAFRSAVENDRWQPGYHSMLGDALRLVGKREEALEAFGRAIELAPTYSAAWVRRGAVLSELDRFDEALEAVDEALALEDGLYAYALTERARILRERGDVEAAVESFQQSVEIDPQQPNVLVELAALLAAVDEQDSAAAYADAALALAPDLADALVIRGRGRRAKGDLDGAVADLTRAAELEPDGAWYDVELGDALLEIGAAGAALEVIERALARQPDHWFALATKGQALRLLGRWDEAVAALREAETHLDGALWVRLELGEALRLSGRPAEALDVFERSLETDPDNRWALAGRGRTEHALGRYTDALRSLDRALDVGGDMEFARTAKASVLIDIGRYDEARALLPELGASASPAWVLGLLATAAELTADGAAALEWYTEYLRLEPASLWARRGAAEALVLLERYDEARDGFERITESTSEAMSFDPTTLAILGWAHLRVGQITPELADERLPLAVQYLTSGLSVRREVVPLQCKIGVALISDGRARRAVAAYDGATSLADRLQPLRRRAVLRVALDDLALAKRLLPDVVDDEALAEIRPLLTAAIERAESEAEVPEA